MSPRVWILSGVRGDPIVVSVVVLHPRDDYRHRIE